MLRTRAFFLRAALLAVVGLAGCVFDPGLPAGAQILCDDDADCPELHICHPASGRCAKATELELDPPALVGPPSWNRTIGTAATTFVLSFDVSEALAGAPTASLAVGDTELAMILDEDASDSEALHYQFHYTASGREPEGLVTASISLLDLSGNRAENIQGGNITFDFTPPALAADAAPDVAALKAGASASVTLAFDEDLAAAPTLALVPAGGAPLPFTLEEQIDARTARFRFAAQGSEPQGAHAIRVGAEDLAGNQVELTLAAPLRLDFVAPASTTVLLSQSAARPGDIVVATATLDEPVVAGAAVQAAGPVTLGFDLDAESTTTALVFRHVVLVGEDGSYALSLEGVRDAAGNEAAAVTLGGLVIDGTAPSLVGFTQSKTSLLGTDTLVVTFGVDEPLATDPVVTLGGLALRLVSGPDPWVLDLDLAGSGLAGSLVIQADLTDLAGNRSSLFPGGATVDARAPGIIDVVFSPESARAGTRALLTVTVDEPLGAPPVLHWGAGGDLPFSFVSQSGFNHSFSLLVDDTVAPGVHVLTSLDVADEAGNAATVVLAEALGQSPSFSVDNVPPSLQGFATARARYSAAPGFDLVEATFDCPDDLDPSGLVATVGEADMACGPRQAASPNYTCVYAVTGFEPEGHTLVAVTARDPAGNVAVASGAIELDFTAPDIAPGSTTLQLIPSSASLVPSVSAVTAGTEARVSFAVTEVLGPDPIVATTTPEVLAFTRLATTGGFFAYRHTLQGLEHAQGAYAVEATLEDEVGNVASRTVTTPAPGLVVDTVPPVRLTEAQRDLLVYTRIPWGAHETQGDLRFTVESTGAGAVAADATIIVWDRANTAAAGELGRSIADAQGRLAAFDLVRADHATAFVSQVDGAGNIDDVTAAMAVGHVEWVVTMGSKVLGSTFENPHRYEARPSMLESLAGQGEVDGAGTVVGGGGSLRTSDALSWKRASFLGRIGGTPSTYDDVRGRIVVAGVGVAAEWDGDFWQRITVTDPEADGSPDLGFPNQNALTAFDSRRGRLVLVPRAAPLAVWEWNGASWQLRQISDPEGDGNPIGSLDNAGAVYDSVRQRTLIVRAAEVQEWNGSSFRRSFATDPEGDGNPPAFSPPFVMFDRERQRVVLIAGDLPAVWEWDNVSWAKHTPTDPEGDGNPAIVPGNSPAYDVERGTTLLFQPATPAVPPFAPEALWSWNGSSWRKQIVTDPEGDGGPTAGGVLVSEEARGVMALFTFQSTGDDVWEWNGTSWRHRAVAPVNDQAVPSSALPAMAWDSARNVNLLLSADGSGSSGLAKLWAWDGARWTFKSSTGPGARSTPLAFDSARGRLVLFGGQSGGTFLSDTWEWDGSAWTQMTPTDPEGDGNPSQRVSHGLTYDAARGVVVLFGGRRLNGGVTSELWEWNGASWAKRTPTDPEGDGSASAREKIALAYDTARGRTVLFGGPIADTWEWNGTSWDSITPTDPQGDGNPSARVNHAMVYDPGRGKVLMFGGASTDASATPNNELWGWDGTSWERLPIADPELDASPGPRRFAALGYDEARGQVVLYGGAGIGGLSDLWEIPAPGTSHVGHVMQVSLPAAGLDPADIESVTARFSAGATGEEGSAPLDGATLRAWIDGRWVPLASTSAGASAPSIMTATVAAPDTRGLPVGSEDVLSVSVVAHGGSRTSLARLTVDLAEVRVRYRQP